MGSQERCIGGAGTGKTRLIEAKLTQAREELGLDTDEVGLCTFTRAGRQELSERVAASWGCDVEALTKHGWFRTAHSIAFKQSGVEEGALIEGKDGAEWTGRAIGARISISRGRDDSVDYEATDGDRDAVISLQAWELARQTLRPLAGVIEEHKKLGDSTVTVSTARAFVEKYERAKARDGRLDFSDVVSRFAGVKHTIDGPVEVAPVGDVPERLRVLAIDEAQDSSAIVDRICRRLAASPNMERVFLVGDPFQCQPAGTPVLTDSGYKPIEELDEVNDRVACYSKKEARVYRRSRFQKAWREVDSSELFEITFDDGTKSLCTRNHQWLVRTKRKRVFATYLMKKGNRFRIGTVQMFAEHKPELSEKVGDFRLKIRMNQENAEAAWALKVFDTDKEARVYEQVTSFRFGIPQITFRPPCGCKNNLDAEFIECVFSTLGDLTENAERCLAAHSLSIELPFLVKGDRSKNGGKACRKVYAANLIPGIHVAPKLSGDGIEWVGVDSIRRCRPGERVVVYSLNVEKHHTYVTTNGIVTGNSIFGFGGSDYRHFMSWAAREEVMPQSYRCPANVMALGEKCLRQMKRGYLDRKIKPASHKGTVREAGTIEEAVNRIDPTKSTLVLGRCGFALQEYESLIKARKIPCSWIDRAHGVASLAGYQCLWNLEHGQIVSGEEWSDAIAMIAVASKSLGKLLHHGEKTAWKQGKRANVDFIRPVAEDLSLAGCTEPLAHLILGGKWPSALEDKHAARAADWRNAAIAHGVDVASNPRVKLSTIHSAKGCEADTVILSTISSQAVENARLSLDERHDEECRVNYVAVTRARENLIVVADGRQHRLEIPI